MNRWVLCEFWNKQPHRSQAQRTTQNTTQICWWSAQDWQAYFGSCACGMMNHRFPKSIITTAFPTANQDVWSRNNHGKGNRGTEVQQKESPTKYLTFRHLFFIFLAFKKFCFTSTLSIYQKALSNPLMLGLSTLSFSFLCFQDAFYQTDWFCFKCFIAISNKQGELTVTRVT